MANTFLTTQEIAREALIRLRENQVMARLVHTDYSNEFGSKGDTINVRKPAVFTANEFTSTISAQDVSESSVAVALDKIADVSVAITSKQMTLNIEDFGTQVLDGAMNAIAQKIDSDLHALHVDIPYSFGTAGTTPDALSDLAGARKILQDNKVPATMRNLVMDTSAEAEFLALDAVVNADKSGSTAALRDANLGRLMGFDVYASQNVADFTTTITAAATPLTAGVTAAGATTINIDSASSLTGVVAKGTIIQIGAYEFVATANATAASNAVAVPVYPAVPAEIADNTAVTFIGSHTANLAFHKNAFAFVNRPMALPSGGADGYQTSFEGLSIRVTQDYSISTKTETMSFDILYGVKTLYPELAGKLLG